MLKITKALHTYRGGQCLIASLLLLLLFSSCNNLFENPSEKNHNTSERKYITVTGSLKLDGAFPAEFIQMYQRPAEPVSSDTSRTAFPSIPSFSTTDFIVEAINTSDSSDKYTGSVSSELNSYTIGIPIADSEKKYKIKITAKTSFGICMTGETPDPVNSPVTVSLTNPVTQNHNITLKAAQDSTKLGKMELTVNIASDAGVKSARVSYTDGSAKSLCVDASGASCTFSLGSVDALGALTTGIHGGSYPMTFEFFSGNLTGDTPPECSGNRTGSPACYG